MAEFEDLKGNEVENDGDDLWLNKFFTEDYIRPALKKIVTPPPGVPFCGAFKIKK